VGIEELAQHCRFRNCTHTNGPGCAVLASMESSELESHHKLKHETSYDGLSSKEIKVNKRKRIFKEVAV
jgi:Predicted GTPases